MRAVIYARYSTGNQSPLSIEDQLRLGRQVVAREGAHVVRELSDDERSGFTGAGGRPGFAELLRLVSTRAVDLVVAEHSNRIARDGEAGWHAFNLFKSYGVKYITYQENEVTRLGQSVSTMLSELKGEETSQFTRRGLEGVVLAGRSAGGLTYGYRKVRAYDAAGEPLRGLLEIDPDQAEVVRRIFRDYASGVSPQAIAHALNREGVAGPRGGGWNASTIQGNAARGTGVIHNELYIGVRVWGRRTFVKDRLTGSRRGLAAAAAPTRRDVADLRILDNALWQAARDRYAQVSTGPMGEGVRGRRRPARLLQGLVVCGLCERPMRRAGPGGALRCSTRIEKGACANGKAPAYAKVEARVIAAIQANLLHPDVIAEAIRTIDAAVREGRRSAAKRRARAEGELAEINRRLERLVDQVEQGVPWSALRARHAELEARRGALEAEAAAPDRDPGDGGDVVAFPRRAEKYRRLVADLSAALEHPDDLESRAGAAAVRALIQEVRLTPRPGHGQYDLEIVGDLAPMLTWATNAEGPREGGLPFAQVRSQTKGELGAGTRVTRRLKVSAPFRQVA